MPQQSAVGFGVSVGFSGSRVVVSVTGDLDVATAPDLERMLAAVIQTGRDQVVLDLSNVEFMGSAALDPVLLAAERLRHLGRRLEVRGVPAMGQRLLEITGVGLTADVAPGDSPDFLRSSPGLTALPADAVIGAGLRLVVDVLESAIDHVGGASVSLRRNGVLATVAASDERVRAWDRQQYDTRRGPCIEASTGGDPVHVTPPHRDERWWPFMMRIRDSGISSVLSLPLTTGDGPVGSLNVYSRRPEGFDEVELGIVTRSATHAARLIVDVGSAGAVDLFGAQFEEMLAVRDAVSQAQGMLMDRSGTSPEGAFEALRRFSRFTGNPLTEIAKDMVEATRRPVDIDLRNET